jgi:hypothetical protein
MFDLFMIVSDPQIAAFVAPRGVSRLFVDLEYIGKGDRQTGDTWKSNHTLQDVSVVRDAAPDAHLMVRVNPLYDGSAAEVNDAIIRGADSLMLPMFKSYDELARFFDLVDGRAQVVPLVETHAALREIPNLIERLPLEQLHIGLNDLHIDMGLTFMFEPIANGTLEEPCAALRAARIHFGIGGIARVGEGGVSPGHLLGEHARLGSTAAILSRTFHRGATTLDELAAAIDFKVQTHLLQLLYDAKLQMDASEIEANRHETRALINGIVSEMRSIHAGRASEGVV